MLRKFFAPGVKLNSQRGCVRVVNEPYLDFRDIPAPRRLPVFGTTLDLIAAGSAPKLHLYVDRRHEELGLIFRESIGPIDAVFVADPVGMRAVFNREGKYPQHILPDAWMLYNKMFGCSRGLFFMDGEEWLHFRKIMNKLLMKSDSMNWLHDPCDLAASAVVERWTKLLQEQERDFAIIPNLESELYKFSIDTMIAVLLGDKYSECKNLIEEDVAHLSSVVHLIFQTSAKLQLIPAKWAAFFKLAAWKNFVAAADNGLEIAHKLTTKLMYECPQGNGLVAKMMKENLSEKYIHRIVADLILAAGDTTAYSMQWVLYLLAKHTEVQNKLIATEHEEYNNLLKGIVKEALRLYPVAPFLTRILQQDISVGGYRVPNGTLVIMSLYSSSRNAKYFPQPEMFWPERWLRNGVREFTAASGQASLPFAMGSRSCIGKKIAETQMNLAVTQITKNFRLELMNKQEVQMILRMVAVPSEAISIKISCRN